MDMLTHFIALAIQRTPMDEMPSTQQLATQFDCPFEFITSIGWVVRDGAPVSKTPMSERYAADKHNDTTTGTTAAMADAERRFLAVHQKYPVLDRLMAQRFALLPGYYNGRTYFVRKQLSFQRPVVAGANWFAVGNATGFTNPLISPGINAGLVGAIKSAELTARCLQADDFADAAYRQRVRSQSRIEYQRYIHDYMLPRLDRMNRFWYNSFRDGRLFEATIVCFWATGSDDRAYLSHHLSAGDLEWLVGAGTEAFAQFHSEIIPLIDGPCDVTPVDDAVVAHVRVVCRRWLDTLVAKYPQSWSSNQRHYNDSLVRVAGKTSRTGGHFHLVLCAGCKYWNTPRVPSCQICGHAVVKKSASS